MTARDELKRRFNFIVASDEELLELAAAEIRLADRGRERLADMLAGRSARVVCDFHARFCEAFETQDPAERLRAATTVGGMTIGELLDRLAAAVTAR